MQFYSRSLMQNKGGRGILVPAEALAGDIAGFLR